MDEFNWPLLFGLLTILAIGIIGVIAKYRDEHKK